MPGLGQGGGGDPVLPHRPSPGELPPQNLSPEPHSHLQAFAPAAPSACIVLPVELQQIGSFTPLGLKEASPPTHHFIHGLFYFFTAFIPSKTVSITCVHTATHPQLGPLSLPLLPAPGGVLVQSGSQEFLSGADPTGMSKRMRWTPCPTQGPPQDLTGHRLPQQSPGPTLGSAMDKPRPALAVGFTQQWGT